MSTIKSQDEDLTLNAHGSGNDIKFQSNGVEKASISGAGLFTSTTIDATKLTGNLPAISGAALTGVGVAGITSAADATAITIDSSENVGIGHPLTTHTQKLVVKKNFSATSPSSGAIINLVNEQGAGNFASIRFTGTNQNAYLGYRDGTTSTDRRLSIGVGADSEHFSFTSNGLTFNGDTAAANGLDDYEEGTWTPALGVAPSGVTLGTVNFATYTKIGNRVFISLACLINSSSVPAPNNDMRITGFPFSNAESNVNMPATFNYNYKVTPQLHINGGGYLYFQSTAVGGNNQSPAGGGLDAVTRLSLAITYRTTA